MVITASQQPPVSGRATIMRALNDINPSSDRLGGGQIDISEPLGVYRLGLDDIVGPSSLDHAQFVGWRYIVEGGGRRTAVAHVVSTAEWQARFTSLARSEQADFLLQAAHLAEKVAESLPGDCEARILTVPSLYVSALWLTAEPPVFIPFLDVSYPVRTADAVTVRADFLADLVQRADAVRERRPEGDRPAPQL